MERINQKDREILRDLAKRQAEIANSPQMKKLKEEWMRHNTFQPGRPMITVELGTFAPDMLPPMLQCQGEQARQMEWALRSNLVNYELFQDDTVVRDHIPVGWNTWFLPFNLPVKIQHVEGVDNSLGHHFVPAIEDFEEDFHKLGRSAFGVNRKATEEQTAQWEELCGDILPVKRAGICLIASLTQNLVHLMSMETMFTAMYDAPELFHKAMEQLTDDYLDYFAFLEREELYLPTTGDQLLCQGTYCFTDELPEQPHNSREVWGYLDSQETVGVSPAMMEEFILPYYQKVMTQCGLVSYGCCEPVDGIWDCFLSKQPNLRKVSISPWCNEEKMGEALRGKRVVYQRKPSPNFLGVGTRLEEDALRAHIRRTVQAAQGCQLELTQRDVYNVSGSPEKVRRYVEILREECEAY